MDPIAVNPAALRQQLPDVPLREGATMMARVAPRSEPHAVIVIAGIPLTAQVPPEVPSGATLRLRVAEVSPERVMLRIEPQGEEPPAPSAQPAPPPPAPGAYARPALPPQFITLPVHPAAGGTAPEGAGAPPAGQQGEAGAAEPRPADVPRQALGGAAAQPRPRAAPQQ